MKTIVDKVNVDIYNVKIISGKNLIKLKYMGSDSVSPDMKISDELKEGDLVVLEGLTKVYEGIQVQTIEEENKT